MMAKRLEALWWLFHKDGTMPAPSACLVGCPGEKIDSDSLTQNFALLRHRALKASPATFGPMRQQMDHFAQYFVAKRMGVPIGAPIRFRGKREGGMKQAGPSRKKLFKDARARFRGLGAINK